MSEKDHDPMRIGPRHLMDLVSDPGFVVLRRREDFSVVARFPAREVSLEEIERAAEGDREARRGE
jgi:hypothetical protein